MAVDTLFPEASLHIYLYIIFMLIFQICVRAIMKNNFLTFEEALEQ